ncbi:hypothetical protein SDC9_108796 [bioreactor metagenome]|uniref:Uncharacterized protein n=1 Tax=bioreactor metagenome TaxID=1076179 RepID=A0A645B934_9ZZZZ
MEFENLIFHWSVTAFNDLLCLIVVESHVRVDNGTAEPLIYKFAFVVHLKYCLETKLLLVRP